MKKRPTSTSFIYKNTDANETANFCAYLQVQVWLYAKKACQNAHFIGLIDGSILLIECVPWLDDHHSDKVFMIGYWYYQSKIKIFHWWINNIDEKWYQ